MKLIIKQDDSNFSPREWDNLCTMVCWHSRYNLGDEQPKESPIQYMIQLIKDHGTKKELRKAFQSACPNFSILRATIQDYHNNHPEQTVDDIVYDYLDEVLDDNKDILDFELENVVMLPLYLYDHSGLTMRTFPFSCPWDSGQVGFAYITKKKMEEEGISVENEEELRQKMTNIINSEVKTYDNYLTGNVYSIALVDDEVEDVIIESCCGFYGEDVIKSGMYETAKDFLDISDEAFTKMFKQAIDNFNGYLTFDEEKLLTK